MSPSPTTARRGWRDSDVDVEAHAPCASDKDLQRSIGSCRIVLKGSERGNQIVDLCQRSPVRVLFPQAGPAGVSRKPCSSTHRAASQAAIGSTPR